MCFLNRRVAVLGGEGNHSESVFLGTRMCLLVPWCKRGPLKIPS